MYMPKVFGDSAISFQFVSGMKEFRFFLDNWGWGEEELGMRASGIQTAPLLFLPDVELASVNRSLLIGPLTFIPQYIMRLRLQK